MVLKNFINYLINKYLKNYIERLDYEKIKLSLKQGHIYLENLRLKPEALAYLNLPATVAVGFIEKLKVTIPWNQLANNATEVHVDGFYLLIVPKTERSQDLTEHYADKMKRVEHKLNHLRRALTLDDDGNVDSKETAFLERLRLQAMQNLIIRVRNLHISYEMKSPSKLGHPFSFGLTVHDLEIITDSNAKSNKQKQLLTYQIKEMNSLSIYWISKCPSRLDMPFETVLKDLKSKIATENVQPVDQSIKYILRPTNLRSQSLITLKPKEHHYERSKMIFDLRMNEINLQLDSEQISDLLDFVKHQHFTTVYDRCHEYRRLLWQQSSLIDPLTNEQKQRLEYLESKLDVFHLAYNRHRVELDTGHIAGSLTDNEEPVTNNSLTRHLHRWDSWAKVKQNLTKKDQRKTSANASSQSGQRRLVFEDLPKIDVTLSVDQLNVDVRSLNNAESLVWISIEAMRLHLKQMCLSSRVECSVELHAVRVFGMSDGEERRRSLIVSSDSPSVQLELELFPLNQQSDYRFRLIVGPLRFFYHAITIRRLIESFENNELVERKSTLVQRSDAQHFEDLSNMKIFALTLQIKGGTIDLPHGGVFCPDSSVIRCKFSDLLFQSSVDGDDPSLFQPLDEQRRFYTKYKLELTDLQIIYLSNRRRIDILRRTPLIDVRFYPCLYPDDTRLVSWRMAATIAMVHLQLSSKLLGRLIDHLQSISSLTSNLASVIKRVNSYFGLFPPSPTLLVDLSIYNTFLRLLSPTPRSIRTDFHLSLTKSRNETTANQHTMIDLKEIVMFSHTSSSRQQFDRNEQLQLIFHENK